MKNVLARLFRDSFEDKTGKIRFTPGGWDFNPSEKLIEKTKEVNPSFRMHMIVEKDADGKDMTLIRRRTVSCTNPEKEKGKYPRHEYKNGLSCWSIPASICRKCEYYSKSDKRYRFARCLFKASESPVSDSLKTVSDALRKAVEETKKIMG